MNTSQRNVELSENESALVVAALFALAHWPFETPRAKSLTHQAAGHQSTSHQAATVRPGRRGSPARVAAVQGNYSSSCNRAPFGPLNTSSDVL